MESVIYVILRTKKEQDYAYGGWSSPATYTAVVEVIGHTSQGQHHADEIVKELADQCGKLADQCGTYEDVEFYWETSTQL